MTTYLKNELERKNAPKTQRQKVRKDQVKNNAGGYVWKIDVFAQLRRFLILGSEGGTYYVSEQKATAKNLKVVEKAIKEDGLRTVQEIVDISQAGRAPKNDQAILALALCVANGDTETKQAALAALNDVCRIGTHLFQFVDYLKTLGSLSGRAKRRAIARWYTSKSPDKLAYQLVKYRNRHGWTHRDVLRVSHPGSIETVDHRRQEILKWAIEKPAEVGELPTICFGFIAAQNSKNAHETAKLVTQYNLPREALKTEHLSSPVVWQALIQNNMPVTALIRNLGNITRLGVFDDPKYVKWAKDILSPEALLNGRVHPLNILFALKTYQSGRGFRGSNSWTPNRKIIDMLDKAFYDAFGAVEPTGKRYLLGLDVSGSMGSLLAGTSLSAREASAAMAMVTDAVEDQVDIIGFTSSRGWGGYYDTSSKWNNGVTPLTISSRQRLDDVVHYTSRIPFGGTDCALPMIYAKQKKMKVDTFIIYTDNETWAGDVHPSKALQDYRSFSGIDAKLIVVGMTSTGFSIADPFDPGMLDVVGFDTATPNIISNFSMGLI